MHIFSQRTLIHFSEYPRFVEASCAYDDCIYFCQHPSDRTTEADQGLPRVSFSPRKLHGRSVERRGATR